MNSQTASDALFEQAEDATIITSEEREGLRPANISLRAELNEYEQNNIIKAESHYFGRKRNPVKESFGRSLHKRMFGDTWKWAGIYRKTEKNIGVPSYRIHTDLVQAYDDVRYWIENNSYVVDEIAARFHHKLVAIHPFSNGNGRWSRMMADILLHSLEQPRFPASGSLTEAGDQRREYIEALRNADNHDFGPLIAFMRPTLKPSIKPENDIEEKTADQTINENV